MNSLAQEMVLKIHFASAGGEFGSPFFLLHIHKTLCHAAQSVVEGRCPVWLGSYVDHVQSRNSGRACPCHRISPQSHRGRQFLFDSRLPGLRRTRSAPTSFDAARTKIQKLEKALEVMGDAVGRAVDVLKSELDKARQAAKVPQFRLQRHRISSNARRNE